MKRDTFGEGQEQELFLDSAEALRGHIRSQVRQALQQVFEEENGACAAGMISLIAMISIN